MKLRDQMTKAQGFVHSPNASITTGRRPFQPSVCSVSSVAPFYER